MASASLAYMIAQRHNVTAVCQTPGCNHLRTFDPLKLSLDYGEQTTLVQLERKFRCDRCHLKNCKAEVALMTHHGEPK